MGFLDKVKETAGKAGEKMQGAVDTGKEKLEDTKLKKKIGEYKEEIGGIVYAQRTGAAPADAEAEITRLVAEIQEAEKQIETNSPEASSSPPATPAPPAEPAES